MRRRSIALAAAVAVFFGQAASAQSLVKALCGDPVKEGPGDLTALRYAAVAGVPYDALDVNGDDTISPDEIFAALTVPTAEFCAAGRPKTCTSDAIVALTKAHNLLDTFITASGSEVVIGIVRAPTAAEIAERPGLAENRWGLVLDERKRFATLQCKATVMAAAATPATGSGGNDSAGHVGGLRLGAFLLGKDVDSLTVRRGPKNDKDRLKKVAAAQVSLESDRVADTRTVSIDGVAGVQIVGSDNLTLIPFVQYVRSAVRDRSAGTDTASGKLALGAVATLYAGDDQFDFAPSYAKDLADRSELVAGRVAWRPGFLYRVPHLPFNNPWHFACRRTASGHCVFGDGLAVWSDFQVIGAFGTVLHRGTDPKLTDGRDYTRVGAAGSVHLYGLNGLARDLSIDLAYKHLFRLSGDGTSISSFKADLNYWIAGSQNVSLLYGYERSRDEDTLKRADLWKLGFGVRF